MKKTSLVAFLLLMLVIPQRLFAGLMEKPRYICVIKTEYFDILFPEESAYTARLLADNADTLYKKAYEVVQGRHTFRMPVVITPDSTRLSVSYSASPYNRIVIYDSVSTVENTAYNTIVLDLFYNEVFRAVSCSKRSPFWQAVSQYLVGDVLQPVSLTNMPFSFVEGFAHANGDGGGLLDDQFSMQLLAQAKLEGRLPNWMQASGAMDIYPQKQLELTAVSAFSAYIQQRWGFDKYLEYWDSCGKIYLFTFYPMLFKKVYGISLTKAWNEFLDAIEIPEEFLGKVSPDANSTSPFAEDNDSQYRFLVHSAYGFVWYDDIKHEVSIFDEASETGFKQLLFIANDVSNLTLSPDGRFLVVSHYKFAMRDNFEQDNAYIYDLKERSAVRGEFPLRDASLVRLPDGTYAVAGVSVAQKHACLQVISAGALNALLADEKDEDGDFATEVVYSRSFDFDTIPFAPVFVQDGIFACPVCRHGEWFLMTVSIADGVEEAFRLCDASERPLAFRNARFVHQLPDGDTVSAFEFTVPERNSFVRAGFIQFDAHGHPGRLLLQNADISGGMHDATVVRRNLFYSAHKLSHDELRRIPLDSVTTDDGLVQGAGAIPPFDADAVPELVVAQKTLFVFKKFTMDGYELKNYNPFSYMFHGTFIPMLPVKNISLDSGTQLYPGLGVAYNTQSDPFLNNSVTLSAAAGFAQLDFSTLMDADIAAIAEQRNKLTEFNRLYTFAAYIENSSTPIDLTLGGLARFNNDGDYDMKLLTGAAWQLPIGMTLNSVRMQVHALLMASTTYMDERQQESNPDLPGWTSISDSYRSLQLSTSGKYSNIHQYGLSPYEKRGFEAGVSLYAVWDFNYIERKRAEEAENSSDTNENSDDASDSEDDGNSNDVSYYDPLSSSVAAATQINFGVYLKIEIPYLNPLKNYKDCILSLPTTLYAELFNSNGTAFKAYAETLLFGKEIQNGIAPLLLYFSRAGLKAGYEVDWFYDPNTVVLPDLREFSRFYDVFSSTYFSDNVYAVLNLDLTPVVGIFSTMVAHSEFKFAFYPQTKGFRFSVNFSFDF